MASMPPPDEAAAAAAEARQPTLTKPPGSLGRLEELAVWLAAWQGRHPPRIDHPCACVFAGSHGVTEEGVSAFPATVTAQMVANFERGGAAINQLCTTFGVALKVEALDLDRPTRNFLREPAMDEAETLEAFNKGMAAVPLEADLLCVGEMGIGNTTVAAALSHAIFGGQASDWTGPGTGVSGAQLDRKTEVVARAVDRHRAVRRDPFMTLACLGGRELAAMAGAVLAARFLRIPVLLDGYVATAAAAVLEAIQVGALDHAEAAHVSAEPAHARLLAKIGKAPLVNLGMRLGEASGAVLAVGILRAAVACHGGMATFAEAGVNEKEEKGE
jgi:nicotinate-nucleotide--dimethylbenzimidazole phosphoribosyltransferase